MAGNMNYMKKNFAIIASILLLPVVVLLVTGLLLIVLA